MGTNINTNFAKLITKYHIVIEHITEVNGFADSVRHVDAFYNIASTLNLPWIVPIFKNSRSYTAGKLPYEIAGLSDFIEHKCSVPKALVNGEDVVHIHLDFNRLVSGYADVHKGSLNLKGVSQDELFLNIKGGLIDAVKIEVPDLESETKTANFFDHSIPVPENSSLPVIHFRLSVHRMPIITKFSNVERFTRALSEFKIKKAVLFDPIFNECLLFQSF